MQVPLATACPLAGISSKTWRNYESQGRAPFPATPAPRRVDLRDLAEYIDGRRAGVRAPFKPAEAQKSASEPRRRGRPRKTEQARQEGGAQ